MKKIVNGLLLFFCCFSLFGCSNAKESHGNNDVEITIDGFTNFDNTIAGKISNSEETFTFGSNVHSSTGCTWKVYKNLAGSEEIVSKTIECEIGDNTVYLFAQNKDKSKLYTIIVHRKYLYTVTYDFNKTINVEEDALINQSELEQPSKTGYNFIGWDYDFDLPVTSDLSISAKWSPKQYKLFFNPGLGSCDTTTMTVTYGESFELPKAYLYGHKFMGWQYNGNGVSFQGTWQFDSDPEMLLEAKYDDNWRVWLEPGKSGTEYGARQFYVDGKTYQNLSFKFGESYTIPDVDYSEGYVFKGWFASQSIGGTYYDQSLYKDEPFPQSGTWNFEHDFSLVAKMDPLEVKVYLDPNGGECSQEYYISKYNVEMRGEIPTPTRTGYTFLGWFVGDNRLGTKNKFLENIYAVARWQANTYKIFLSEYTEQLSSRIVLNVPDGDDYVYKQSYFTFDNNEQLCPDFKKDSGIFLGWCIDENRYNYYDWSYPLKPGTNLYAKKGSEYDYGSYLHVYRNEKKFTSNYRLNGSGKFKFFAPYTGEYNLYFETDCDNQDTTFEFNVYEGAQYYKGELVGSSTITKSDFANSIKLQLNANTHCTIEITISDSDYHNNTHICVAHNCKVKNFFDTGELAYYVDYDQNYNLGVPSDHSGTFVGWFTEPNGGGVQITNGAGESLLSYNFLNDINLYPYFM